MRVKRLQEIARQLSHAWTNVSTVPPPTVLEPSLTVEDAYSIQESVIARRLDGSRKRDGWKLGLTSAPPPVTPIVGTLLSDMVLPSGSELSLSTLVAPMVEAELVVRIGETIDGPRSLAELTCGRHQVGPGLEVIDYRTTGDSGVVDWIADNSTTAYAVVGDLVPVADVDPPSVQATLTGDGEVLATGQGRSVMGNPLAAVVWLTEHMARRGQPLEEGQVVLTGTLTGAHPVPKDRNCAFRADFDRLGSVEVAFRPD